MIDKVTWPCHAKSLLDGYWFKCEGMVHLVWIGGKGVPPVYTKLSCFSEFLKVNHSFALKPITVKVNKFTNFWMLFQMTCPSFNSINIEYSYQEKICLYPVPCSLRTWPILSLFSIFLLDFSLKYYYGDILYDKKCSRLRHWTSQILWEQAAKGGNGTLLKCNLWKASLSSRFPFTWKQDNP